MYPQQTGAPSTSISNYSGGTALQAPQPSGVASRVTELQKAVQELETLSCQAKGALGIQQPSNDAKASQKPSNLAEVLTDLRIRITRTCRDIEDVIQHLNS